MCGIFGAVVGNDAAIPPSFAGEVVKRLFRYSESRGREAAGVAVYSRQSIDVLKQAGSASTFVRAPGYQRLVGRALDRHAEDRLNKVPGTFAMMGHSRLVTNGLQSSPDNNQPVVAAGVVAVHNGIVVNDRELWQRHAGFVRQSSVDTEVVAHLVRKHFDLFGNAVDAAAGVYSEIEGSASLAMFLDELDQLILTTNTGSLFHAANERGTFLVFGSERFILRRLIESPGFAGTVGRCTIEQLRARNGLLVDLATLERRSFNGLGLPPKSVREGPSQAVAPAAPSGRAAARIVDHTKSERSLRRCTKCILPETYPFVDFDADGVCHYCRAWQPIRVKGADALARAVEPYRSKDGSPDVIVAFSGGRDSSYGLHYVKRVLGMNPVAFTYDWGLVTDLARRNQARICGALGVEHIVRSADIAAKRRYVRKNVQAWLKRPELGMVTLFTAGDKEFYRQARLLREETGIKLVIFCTGNMIEDTPYKTGLCGIREKDHGMTLTGLHFSDEARLVWYYLKNFIRNPAYFNESFLDTLNAYYQTFVVKDDFLYLYHYLPWKEEEVVGTIRREYNWEVAPDTTSTWRIGDWTAAFYNYIYLTLAGWTEDEVMLSNMIREGDRTREDALRLAAEFRQPRIPTLQEYAQAVGFNLEEAMTAINAAPKLY